MTALEVVASAAAIAASTGALARASTRRRLHLVGVPLLLTGWLGLLAAVLPEPLRERGALLVAGLALLLSAAWLLAGLLQGREHWLLALGAAVLTLRVPVPSGDGTAMLLLPFYAVTAIGALVLVRRELAGQRPGFTDRGGATRLLDVGAAALPAVATISLTWSLDPSASAEALAFFLVPFVLAYAIVRAWLSDAVSVRPAGWTLLAAGVLAALVGLLQAATRQVWWNPKVIDANRFRPDFRTNSIYWDPNIYGRALVVTILLLVAWLLVARWRPRQAYAAVAACALLTLALWHTFSQSSWIALAAALVVIAVLTLPPRARRWTAALLAVVVVAGLPLAADRLAGDDAEGRTAVVRSGLALASERPIGGWGIGTFEAAARERARSKGERDPRLTASHTTPVTIFAELGVIGAATYLTLLTAAALAVLARWRRSSSPAAAARARGEAHATGWPGIPTIWATGVLVALFAHSLLYAGFFEDPTLWVALAVLASLPLVREQVPEADPR